MRSYMRDVNKIRDEKMFKKSERSLRSEELLEKWSKKKGFYGNSMVKAYNANPSKIKNLVFVLENQERYLQSLTETEISSNFSTTPENVMRIVRLGYPNSVRGDIFLEWGMETSRDSIYYLKPKYTSTTRGATDDAIMHESASYRYASEIEEDTLGSADGSTTTFSTTLANIPLRPYTVKILDNQNIVATDNGSGTITGTGVSGTVNYTTGVVSVTWTTAPISGHTLVVVYNYDSEVSGNYTDVKNVELQLLDYQFRVKPWPIYVSWSKMTELLLGTTLNIDVEDALVRGASDELKKSLDFQALRLGYRRCLGNTGVTFNADWSASGADSEKAHVQSFSRAVNKAADVIYASLQRGGVTKIYGGPDAVSYLEMHDGWSSAGRQPAVGAFKFGSLGNIDVFKCPSSIVPTNELVCVYKNEEVPEDVSIAFGTLIPLYITPGIEYKNFYKEYGLAHFGDGQTLQSGYLVRIRLDNLTGSGTVIGTI